MKVQVYYNLHKHLWSVKALAFSGVWYVAFHAQAVLLENVEWKVSEAGRQRVLKYKRKHVHAFGVGTMLAMRGAKIANREYFQQFIPEMESAAIPEDLSEWSPTTYDPYKNSKFMVGETPILKCDKAFLVKREKAEVYSLTFQANEVK